MFRAKTRVKRLLNQKRTLLRGELVIDWLWLDGYDRTTAEHVYGVSDRSGRRNGCDGLDLPRVKNWKHHRLVLVLFLLLCSCIGLYWFESCGLWMLSGPTRSSCTVPVTTEPLAMVESRTDRPTGVWELRARNCWFQFCLGFAAAYLEMLSYWWLQVAARLFLEGFYGFYLCLDAIFCYWKIWLLKNNNITHGFSLWNRALIVYFFKCITLFT